MSFVIPSADGHKAEDERFRLYRRRDGQKRALCVATTAEPGGIGQALVQLAVDGDLQPEDHIGVMDTFDAEGRLAVTGRWLVNPYARPIG